MKCYICGRKFGDGEHVIPVLQYTTNAKRGDFVGYTPIHFFHAHHLKEQ